jgi:DNA-binding transcriptional ArsR family regulator
LSVVADIYKALADPTRRAILDELVDRGDQTLFELCTRLATKHGLGSSRQAISQHLDVLEAAGLVRTTRREGRYKFHNVHTAPLRRPSSSVGCSTADNRKEEPMPKITITSVLVDDQDKALASTPRCSAS